MDTRQAPAEVIVSRLSKKINADVLSATGFDLPELGGDSKVSRAEILEALRHAKRWHENFAQQCQTQLDNIIYANFSEAERDAEV